MVRLVVVASASTTVTLALLAATVAAANFAPGPVVLLALLAVPLSIGLPTTAAVAVVTWLWPGQALGLYAASCVVVGLGCQTAAVALWARWRRRR